MAEALPARLRGPLLAAFGTADDAAPELFLVALATLELVADASEGSPVLLVVEDAQCSTSPTARFWPLSFAG